MRAYKFLSAEFGLKSLYEKRIKISTIDDLNDPFELIPFDLRDRQNRWAALETRKQMSENRGLLCLSADWRDPVIWAHYSNKHKGICLGFDIPNEVGKLVRYEPALLPFPESPNQADMETMLWTKYSNWQYEHEIRIWAALDDEEDGVFYKDFGDDLRLMEVIAGARCSVPERSFARALVPSASHVKTIKARAGFGKFEMVEDQRGFREVST
jgi:hypothetical protein